MSGIPASLSALAVPIAGLRPYAQNPRTGDVGAIAESLSVNGQYRPVVVNRGTGEVLAGNHTLLAARSLGWTEIAATFVDCSDEEAARIVLVDNRASDLAGYDEVLLAQVLGELPGLAGTGFDQAYLDELLVRVSELPPPLADPDDVPDLPAAPVSVLGDVWVLGCHRLVCGDSTDAGAVDALMVGGLADCVWTDPPYGVAYEGGSKKRDVIHNDALDVQTLTTFLRDALGLSMTHTLPGAVWYVAAPHGPMGLAFSLVMHELDVWRHSLVWVKNNSTFGRADYHYRHEPIYYGWTPGAAHHAVTDRKQDTLWEFDRPRRSDVHPTMKPVALIERALLNSTDKGATVLDPFAGSGSTLIACHQLGRVARLVELDPRYVDVICRRYQQATGDKPVREATGEPWDFTDG